MNNEEILQQLNSEDKALKRKTGIENRVFRQGDRFGGNIAGLLCIILILLKLIITHSLDTGLLATLFCLTGIQDIVEGKELKHWKTILGIVLLIAALFFVIIFIGGLFNE